MVADRASRANSHSSASRRPIEDEKHSSSSDMPPALTDSLNAAVEAKDYPSPFIRWAIVIALLLGEFLIALDLTIVATAIPRITDEFKSIADVGWYGSAFFLTFAAYQSAWGKVYKYFDMRNAFFASVVVFVIGSIICAAAPKSAALIIGRAITGVGAAGVTNGVYTIIACIVPPRQVAMYFAFVGVVFSIASVAGPLLGGIFTEKLTWRWCFWINLPVGAASLGVVLFFFRTPKLMKAAEATLKEKLLQMDLQGTVLIVASLVCYMLAMQWGGISLPWNSATIIGLLVGWIVLGICFVIDQWLLGDRAQIVTRIIKDRTVAGLSAFILFLNATTFLLIYYLPIYFQAIDDLSPSASGVRSLPLILAMSIALLASSALVSWIGYFHPLLLVGSVLLTVGAGLIFTLDIGSSTGEHIGYQILVGAGNGISSQIPIIASLAFAAPEDIAVTTALVLFFQLISGALSVSLAQTLFTNTLLSKLPLYAPTVDPAVVIAVGASELRKAFAPDVLPGVLQAYMAGLKASWEAGIVLAGLALLAALVPRWESIQNRPTSSGGTVA
ncbi:hypothetical protein EPUS_01350 [Endocarpon pusillum Z07020]|uniref:Major facilitator superfamily (MFS) profile domain-containing protein n=1 Tax=Endocarpon pusillum (strain Z07020 / HMAS-L-300199) TaxID=1263415 RepID=U1I206_ENDPU|nr:uncharacterized protein EPUS_01350 [Endocarpon pusillum Z07020]ERF75984.1 hypothetical protein EPUS_01350 [Endocarpon pusillum Z07020]